MRRNYDPETLTQYKYPNLVAEFMESGISICDMSEHMGLGECREDDSLINAKIFGKTEFFHNEAIGLTKLFQCDARYLFAGELSKVGDIPIAYIRHNLPVYYKKDMGGGVEYRDVKDIDHAYKNYREYSECMASDEVKNTAHAHGKAFDDYINAVVEDSWKKGFEYAMRLVEESIEKELKSA